MEKIDSEVLRAALSELVMANLNELVKVDVQAIDELIEKRVPCNQKMIDHPTVVCLEGKVGLLGVLNGILQPLIGHCIAAELDDNKGTKLLKFIKYKGK
jgi:hypothetical protein